MKLGDLWRALDGLEWSLGKHVAGAVDAVALQEGDCYLVINFGPMPEAEAKAEPILARIVGSSAPAPDQGGEQVTTPAETPLEGMARAIAESRGDGAFYGENDEITALYDKDARAALDFLVAHFEARARTETARMSERPGETAVDAFLAARALRSLRGDQNG